jgi:acetyl esterase
MGPLVVAERLAARGFLRLPSSLVRRIVGPPIRSPEGFELDLQSQALLWLIRARREPEMRDANLDRARRRMDRAASILAPTNAVALDVRDREIAGADGPRRCRVYRPVAAKGDLVPGLLWFHGGGFVLGSLASHDGVCRALSSRAGIAVVAVDYRLAPEHRFPAGFEDALAATRWILDRGEVLGVASRQVAVGGDSAGGNFVAGVTQALRGAPLQPRFQLLAYPATDATRRGPSHGHFRAGFILGEDNISWYLDHYLADPALARDPRVSPIFAEDLSNLPPSLVMTAGFDPLRDEGALYAQRMSAAGNEVEMICSEGSMHGFLSTAGGIDESTRLLALAADRLRRRLLTSGSGA